MENWSRVHMTGWILYTCLNRTCCLPHIWPAWSTGGAAHDCLPSPTEACAELEPGRLQFRQLSECWGMVYLAWSRFLNILIYFQETNTNNRSMLNPKSLACSIHRFFLLMQSAKVLVWFFMQGHLPQKQIPLGSWLENCIPTLNFEEPNWLLIQMPNSHWL